MPIMSKKSLHKSLVDKKATRWGFCHLNNGKQGKLFIFLNAANPEAEPFIAGGPGLAKTGEA